MLDRADLGIFWNLERTSSVVIPLPRAMMKRDLRSEPLAANASPKRVARCLPASMRVSPSTDRRNSVFMLAWLFAAHRVRSKIVVRAA